jgi:hypothetical protein
MKDLHKAVMFIILVMIAIFAYHMVTNHAGQSLMPAGLGSK